MQRVRRARVDVAGETVGEIGLGLLVLVGIGSADGESEMAWGADRIRGLRIFPDDEGRMNRSVVDVGGGVLAVSQFTLYAEATKGRRPSFTAAAPGEVAEPLFDRFVTELRAGGIEPVETGQFGANMDVHSENFGPVTIWIDREPTSTATEREAS